MVSGNKSMNFQPNTKSNPMTNVTKINYIIHISLKELLIITLYMCSYYVFIVCRGRGTQSVISIYFLKNCI